MRSVVIPPYPPDLAPTDFHLFLRLKVCFGGKRFSTEEKLNAAVDNSFRGLEESRFRDGIRVLGHRWMKCIELRGDNVENKTLFLKNRIFSFIL